MLSFLSLIYFDTTSYMAVYLRTDINTRRKAKKTGGMQTTAAEMTEAKVEVKADTETKNKVKKKGRKKKDGKRKQTRTKVEEEMLGDGDGVLEKSAKKCGSDSSNKKKKKKKKNKEKKEKKTKPKKSPYHLFFSIDLVEQAKRHIIFLRTLHKQGITIDDKEELLEESFRRYSQLWLPFVAHHHHRNHYCSSLDDTNNETNQTPTAATDIALIPPPDIAWFWHCHRLAPYRYAKYVRRVLFTKDHHDDDVKVLDPSHPFVVQLEKNNKDCNDTWRQLVPSSSLSSSSSTLSSTLTNPDNEDYAKISQCTRDLFAEMYPNESFFLVLSSSSASSVKTTPAIGHLLAGFNLIESCRRQATFLWQVSGPNFLLENNDINDTFLREGMKNYARFVKLTNHPQRREMSSSMSSLISPLVPTYQIDLIWHTHILSSIKNYHKDVMKLTAACATTSGSSRSRKTIVLNHDDSIDNDRSEGSVLDTSFQQTRNLWKDVYGLEYVVMGGMYRGEPPPEYYHMDWTPSSQLPSIYASRSIKMTKYATNNDAFVPPSSPDVDWRQGGVCTRDTNGNYVLPNRWMPFDHDEGFVSPSSPDVDRGWSCDRNLKRDNPYLEGYVYGLGGTYLCLCSILFYMFCFDSLLDSFSCKSYIVCIYVPYLLS
jgi:hypothetical protein